MAALGRVSGASAFRVESEHAIVASVPTVATTPAANRVECRM